jgi:hypothetical protein
MNPQEPVIPDPDAPADPAGPVGDPADPNQPVRYDAADNEDGRLDDYESEKREGLDDYDEAVADSFPASDPPAASQPGAP